MNTVSKEMNQKFRGTIIGQIVKSMWIVLNTVFSSPFYVIEIDGESGGFTEDGKYYIRLGIGTASEDRIVVNSTDEFEDTTNLTRELIKKFYNIEPTQLFYGPQSVIIGIPRDTVNHITVSCEEYEDEPTSILINKCQGNKYYLLPCDNIPKGKNYCIELSIERTNLVNVKEFSDEKIFNYLAFYMLTWLEVNPHFEFDGDEFRKRINDFFGGDDNASNENIEHLETKKATGDNL